MARALELPWGPGPMAGVRLAEVHRTLTESLHLSARASDPIVAHLAVRQAQAARAEPAAAPLALLCLAGPRGVGTTTITRGLAAALSRPAEVIELAQLESAADFFGREAAPGALMRAVERAGSSDAVVILEGLDQFGSRWQSDPYALVYALTEPTRLRACCDPYFGVPFDCSPALMIATARWTHELPEAVRDRLDIVEAEGYVEADKLAIARDSVVPSVLAEYNVPPERLAFDDGALLMLIRSHTSAARLAQLEGLVRRVIRRVLTRWALDGDAEAAERVGGDNLADYAGRPPILTGRVRQAQRPGVAGTLAPIHRMNPFRDG